MTGNGLSFSAVMAMENKAAQGVLRGTLSYINLHFCTFEHSI